MKPLDLGECPNNTNRLIGTPHKSNSESKPQQQHEATKQTEAGLRAITYKIEFKPTAERDLSKCPLDSQKQIVTKIIALQKKPLPGGVKKLKKLSGEEKFYRVRVRNYRIIYQICYETLTILVLVIGHRSEVYRRLR